MHPPAPGLSADVCMGVREEGWVGDCVHILGQMSWYLCSGLGDGCAGGVVLSAGERAVCTGCMEGLQGCEVQLCALLVQHVRVSQDADPLGKWGDWARCLPHEVRLGNLPALPGPRVPCTQGGASRGLCEASPAPSVCALSTRENPRGPACPLPGLLSALDPSPWRLNNCT